VKLIVSAFREDVNPWRNAQQTAALLQAVSRCNLLGEIVMGRYNGKLEASICVSSFPSKEKLCYHAENWRRQFSQQSVLIICDGKAYSLSDAGTEYLGEAVFAVDVPPTDNYTHFLDGRVLTVREAA